jgi:ribosomal protein S18 acetylase RimI-like enzyme
VPSTDPTVVARAAANLAGWHSSSVEALSLTDQERGGWWTCPLPGPTIYHGAISLRPAARRRRLRALLADESCRYVSVCDSFADLDLAPLGLRRHTEGSWYQRPPGAVPGLPPPEDGDELEITTVSSTDQLADFEATMVRAFEVPILVGRFDVHAPGILRDPAMTSVLGTVDGRSVCVAMAYQTVDRLGLYGVGTVPDRRGRGHATTLVQALLALAPDKPAVLQPTEVAKRLYQRLGFVEVGRFAHWV